MRRDFIMVFVGAAAWTSTVWAEEPRHVVDFLSAFESSNEMTGDRVSFYHGLRETGFVEGRDISVEFRWANGHYDRLPSLAAELVGRNVSVIFADDLPSALAAKAATQTIPIVFAIGADPVKVGLVGSLSRPSGNLTGVTVFLTVLGPKRVELLHELLPEVNTIALLGNPGNPNFQPDVPDIRAAAEALNQRLEVLTASNESDLEAAFASMAQHRVGALILVPDPFLIPRRDQLVLLAARRAIPAMYPSRLFADRGGLISYGSSLVE